MTSNAEHHCSIIWDDSKRQQQLVVNCVRFAVDVATLLLILFASTYIGLKGRFRELKYIDIQMVLLLVAQVLYCMRSFWRFYKGDDTYFGSELPNWTASCKRAANVINFFQHWLYTVCYFKVAILFDLSFKASSLSTNAKRNRYERCIGYLNGSVYSILCVSFFLVIFSDPKVFITIVYTVTSLLMTVCLAFSMLKII